MDQSKIKKKETITENIGCTFNKILDQNSIEKSMEILIEHVPYLFINPENVSVRLKLLDREWRSTIFNEDGIPLAFDISVNGKKEGILEIRIPDPDKNIEQIKEHENLLHLLSGMLSAYLEKSKGIEEIELSERKTAEEIVKRERDKFMNYLDVAGSIIGIVNRDMEVIFVNKKGAEVLGCTKEEIIGKKWFDNFLPESVREETKKNYIRVINSELDPPDYFENLIVTKDGEERLIYWHDVPIEDENGERVGVISSGEDITENRKMEALLKESEKNLKTIFDHIDDQIYIYRPYGKLIDVNRAALTSTGYSKEEMLEMSLEDMIKPEMAYLLKSHEERIIKEKNVIFEICSVRKDGTLLPIELNSGLIVYKGEPAILSVARDITERKKAEKRLKKYTKELKHSNELKELFTDIIRHDLLTPASIVKGYTDELIDNIENENALKLAEKIRDYNDRLIQLLETATKLSKLQKEEDITFDKLDLLPVIKVVADSFKNQIDENRQELIVKAEGNYFAMANPVIEEVFANLLSNAIKYSPPKSRIEIELTDEQDMWKISVTDFGIGIPDADKSLLFNRFQRADKKGIKGTGLGLAIVKRIIELHGGKYGVEDNPAGKGSVFWIMIRKA